MSSPSQEQLLGYVLGALEPLEHEQLERELAQNPELAQQVEALTARLLPLDCCRAVEPPPAGLSTRTCAFVFSQAQQAASTAPAGGRLAASMSADYGGESSRWSLADLVVAAGIFLAAGMLFFPAIANSRYQAQVAQCQNNLRQFGEGLQRAQSAHPEIGYDNVLTLADNRAASGILPVMLRDQGFLERDNLVLCPSSPEATERNDFQMPTLQQVDATEGEALTALYRQAAGSFAYSIGYRSEETAASASPPSSDLLAVACDAPTGAVPNLVSTHHDGKGQNVLFASGRTAYVCGCGDQQCGDSLFWNRNLKIEAGLDRSDMVLARGGTRPFAMPVVNLLND